MGTTDRLPPLELLEPAAPSAPATEYDGIAHTIERVAGEHGTAVTVVDRHIGPQAVRFLVEPGLGVLPRKIEALTDALSVRIGAQVRYAGPQGTALGIEVPVLGDRVPVRLRTLIEHGPALTGLGMAVGLSIDGDVVTGSLARLPHLLVGGATGQGKSVLVNTLLVSLLMRCTPADLQLTLVDPKRVELSAYAKLPHLAQPIVTEISEAAEVLKAATREMDLRYQRFEAKGVKDVSAWNDRENVARMPRHVIVVDELADLVMTGGKGVEEAIVRLAQLGRAAGFHLILATQYPNAKVVTPLIKQNVPSSVALTTRDHTASNLIIGCSGAEKLTGAGDALWAPIGSTVPVRMQTALVTDDEVARIVAWWVETERPKREQQAVLDRLRRDREADEERRRREHEADAAAAREAATARAQQVLADPPQTPNVLMDGTTVMVPPREAARVELAERLRREREEVVERVELLERTLAEILTAVEVLSATIKVGADQDTTKGESHG